MNDPLLAQALPLVEQLAMRFEGFRPQPYLCPAGVPTIGYGSTYYLDGRPVRLSDPAISETTARVMLRELLTAEYLPAVRLLCPTADTAGRLAALADFAFNLGVGRLRASTLRQRALAGEWDQVPAELRKWVSAGGKRLRGLVLRREAEIALL